MKETPLRPAASLASPSQDPAAAARAVRCACACRAARRPLPPAPEGPRGLRARRSPGVSCLGPSGGDRARRSWRATGQAVHGAAPEARAGERRRRRNGTRAARMGEATRVTTGRGAAARRVPCTPSTSGLRVLTRKSAGRHCPIRTSEPGTSVCSLRALLTWVQRPLQCHLLVGLGSRGTNLGQSQWALLTVALLQPPSHSCMGRLHKRAEAMPHPVGK